MLIFQNTTIKTSLMRGNVPYWFLFEKENFRKKFNRDMVKNIWQSGIDGDFSYGMKKHYIEYLTLMHNKNDPNTKH
jgi:hypothetical protein